MISVWFLGLQYLISRYGQSAGSMPTLYDSQFVQKKVQYKLQEKAHGKGYIYSRFVANRIRKMAKIYRRDEEEFWKIYDKKKYVNIKEKYDSKNNFLNIYEKVCSFYIKYFNSR